MFTIKHYEFYYHLRTLPFVEEIWLFGSRAKKSETERSDIDLAILCPSATAEQWQEVRSIIDTADTLLQIDCVRFDVLEDIRLKQEILATKEVLFKRVANSYPWYDIFLDLGEALDKFAHILTLNKTNHPYLTEATIQIFEYTYELYWKLLKKICASEGIEVNSPKATLQQAYAIKLIDQEQIWLEMMENRNLTSHTYKQPTANLIYTNCTKYLPVMIANYDKIKQKYKL